MLNTLDLRGMKCPLPLLKTQKYLKVARVGEEFIVQVTDQNAIDDFEALERFGTIQIVETSLLSGELHFRLRKII